MNKKYIERMAINSVCNYFTTKTLYPNIPFNDCEPSYDGHINYQPNGDSKKDYRFIPVQVKGTTLQIDKSFKVDINDLENYRSYGVIFILVVFEEKDNILVEKNMKYKTLLKYDIDCILANSVGQKSCTIELNDAKCITPLDICQDYMQRFDDLIKYAEYKPEYGDVIDIIFKPTSGVDDYFNFKKYCILKTKTGEQYYSYVYGEHSVYFYNVVRISYSDGTKEIPIAHSLKINVKSDNEKYVEFTNGIKGMLDDETYIIKLIFDSKINNNKQYYDWQLTNSKTLALFYENDDKPRSLEEVQLELL